MKNSTDLLFSIVDRLTSQLEPINYLVDSVADRIVPKATASGICFGCSTETCPSVCENGYWVVYYRYYAWCYPLYCSCPHATPAPC